VHTVYVSVAIDASPLTNLDFLHLLMLESCTQCNRNLAVVPYCFFLSLTDSMSQKSRPEAHSTWMNFLRLPVLKDTNFWRFVHINVN